MKYKMINEMFIDCAKEPDDLKAVLAVNQDTHVRMMC